MDPPTTGGGNHSDIEKQAVVEKGSILKQEKAAALISPRITAIRRSTRAPDNKRKGNQYPTTTKAPSANGDPGGEAPAATGAPKHSLGRAQVDLETTHRIANERSHPPASTAGTVKASGWRGLRRKDDKGRRARASFETTLGRDCGVGGGGPPTAAAGREESEDAAVSTGASRAHDSFADNVPSPPPAGNGAPSGVQLQAESFSRSRTPEDGEGLAVATPVNESSRVILSGAQEIDPEQEEVRLKAQRTKSLLKVGLPIAGGALVLITGVIMVLTLVVFPSREATTVEATSVPTLNPSESPTQSPTSAPTMLLMDLPDYMQEAMMTPLTPQSRARQWLDGYTNITGKDQWRKRQLYALATFFYSFHGDEQWPPEIRDDWLDEARSECDWWSFSFVVRETTSGVNAFEGPEFWINEYDLLGHYANVSTCKADRFVVLDFSGFTVSNASIPAEISLLSSLETISIYRMLYNTNTKMDDLLPSELGLLSNLTTYKVAYSNIPSTIPTTIGLLRSLDTLHLYYNDIIGHIPSEVGLLTALSGLRLDWNPISGTIPTEIGMLSHLNELNLWETGLAGQLPSEVGLLTALATLDLFETSFTGTLPTDIGRMNTLSVLYVAPRTPTFPVPFYVPPNSLSGPLPSELGLMNNLTILHVSNTRNVSGTIPTEIGLLSYLKDLTLTGNALTGAVPSELGLLTLLTSLRLSQNLLTGPLPSELARLTGLTTYYAFQISSNSISGQIPSEFGLLGGLEAFEMDNNVLSGTLPTELGLMSALGWPGLVLSHNHISGTLPTELFLLTNLSAMRLSKNIFSGTIPTEVGYLTSMHALELANNSLVGTIPIEIGQTDVSTLDLSFNDLTGSIPGVLGLLFSLDWLAYFLSLTGNNFTGSLPSELCYMLLERGDDFLVDCSQVDCSGCNE